jgi:hypothetical protein
MAFCEIVAATDVFETDFEVEVEGDGSTSIGAAGTRSSPGIAVIGGKSGDVPLNVKERG